MRLTVSDQTALSILISFLFMAKRSISRPLRLLFPEDSCIFFYDLETLAVKWRPY